MGHGYSLIIAEKPNAMRKIAHALAEGRVVRRVDENGVSFYEIVRDGRKIVVVSSVGHLFSLDSVDGKRGWYYPVFEARWKPRYELKKEFSYSRKYLKTIERLSRDANEFIIATDYDVEGDVIGYNILRFVCGVSDAKRMVFSTLTKEELVKAFENLRDGLDFHQVEAGLTRHALDWLWGINLTRALTLALRNFGGGKAVLSIGRVQGPLLKILYDREMEIRNFVPKPYWQVELTVEVEGKLFKCLFEEEKIWEREKATEIFRKARERSVAKVEKIAKKLTKQLPPPPFNTTDLQAEAYSCFKFSPTKTLEIAESLYQKGHISYPRSSSQKLPKSVGYRKILSALSKLPEYRNLATVLLAKERLVPREGKATDPAHPAIYPTWEVPELWRLSREERKVYDLIVRRTLATFADPVVKETVSVKLRVGGLAFKLSGKRVVEEGWSRFYQPYLRWKEEALPSLSEGDRVRVVDVRLLEKKTQPPGRYSPGSVVKELERRKLGTKATRAEILRILYERKYIRGNSITVTKLGEAVVKALEKNCPEILSEELTRRFEREMEMVYKGEKSMESVVEGAKLALTKILEGFKAREAEIGKELAKGLVKSRVEERVERVLQRRGYLSFARPK